MATLRRFPVLLEAWGWDEAFLGTDTDDPDALAREVRHAVSDRTGLACSVGIGDSKQRAKLATGFAKPAGVFRLTAEQWPALMGHRSTVALWGVGPRRPRSSPSSGCTRSPSGSARPADPGTGS